MAKCIRFAAATIVALICGTLVVSPVFGQQLLAGFEQTLNSTAGNTPFGGQWTTNPDYTSIGATEGTKALALHHSTSWVTDGIFLKGNLALAQQVAQYDFMTFDVTTTDLGTANDGMYPFFRQLWVIYNSNQGGWQQSSQIDFPVAADDGGSLTAPPIVLDLATSGIKANAQAFVNSGGGPNSYWELFVVFQGADQGVIKAGDYNNDGHVNGADYNIWRKTLGGSTLTNETASPGIVDPADYDAWRANYGNDYTKITTIVDNFRFLNAGAGAGALANGTVPEPSSMVLLAAAALTLARFRRARI